MADKITFKKLAELVLENAKKPLTPLEIWEAAKQIGLFDKLGTVGKTPWLTISAQIYVDIRDNPKSIFYQYSSRPGRFFLRSLEKISNQKKPY